MPFHDDGFWTALKADSPAEWADAVAFDAAIRHGSARANADGHPLRGQFFLLRQRVPLDQVVLRPRPAAADMDTKKQSKLNALSAAGKVEMAPLGYLPHLGSQKVAHLNLEAQGWAGTAVSLDVKLNVHDPSGAAGVNIDLVRIAASANRAGLGGYATEATTLLKSPPGTAI